jgi:signal transduction histidine kinase/GAF domain-containing protein
MLFLRDLVELITTPPGDLVYHLVTLFAIQVILGVAFGHWNRNRRDPAAIRLLVIGVGFALARILLMLVAVLDRVGVLSPNVVLPPLERSLDLATLLLAVWAFLPILERYSRLGVVLLFLTLLITAGAFAAFATVWPQAEELGIAYNGYWQDTAWEISAIAILVLALIASVIWHDDDWGLIICLFALWLAGHILQYVLPFTDSHTAGWVRLANLAALPLVAGLVYRHVLNVSPAASEGTGLDGLEIVSILGAAQRIEATRDTEAALGLAASSIAHVLGADMIAIGLPAPAHPGSPKSGLAKKLRIVALHPATGTMLAHQEPTLLISRHPLLATAIKTGHLQHSAAPLKDPTVATLYYHLGFERPGPLLAQSLVDAGALLGVIIAGNPVSQRSWTMRDEQILQAVSAAITISLANAARRETTDRSAKSRKALREARHLAQRAAELEAELGHQRQRAEELATKLRLREQEAATESQSTDEAAIWHEEMHKLAEASLQNQAALEAELAEWKERAETLTFLNESLQTQLAQVEVKLQGARNQAHLPTPSDGPIQDVLDQGNILMSDGQGNIVLASQGARHLIGRHCLSLVGKPLQTLFAEPLWVEVVNRLSREETPIGDTATVTLDLDGQVMQAELTRLPAIADGPGTLAVMLYPEEAKVQGEMVISLIHELRTPMTSITGYTKLLLGESVGILGEMQRQFLQRVNANIERMGGLLEDLVRVTAIDAGQISHSPEPVDLIDVIEDAIMSLSAQFSERKVGVQMDMPSELPSIHADRDSLYQIVLRLLSNACQCSEAGAEVLVRARLEEYGDQMDDLPDHLFMSVTDTGGGIAPEDQRRVFQRLYRADNPLIAGLGDTGVGLSIAKALVEAQGGRIWVESEVEVGSTFSFVLPLSSEGGSEGNSGRLPEPSPPDPSPARGGEPERGQ